MEKIRVTKEFRFEAAHALTGYDGPCRNIHGHSYELSVTVIGVPEAEPDKTKLGMVIDFGDLKKLVKALIIDRFDHALVLKEGTIPEALTTAGAPFSKLVIVPYQPTSENLLTDFASMIGPLLPQGVLLHSMRLRETATSYAEWHRSDNS